MSETPVKNTKSATPNTSQPVKVLLAVQLRTGSYPRKTSHETKRAMRKLPKAMRVARFMAPNIRLGTALAGKGLPRG